MTNVQTIKKSTLQIQEQQPRNIQRADIAPAGGFALVVDGHFKTQFESEAVAQKAAKELLGNYPMLRVEIYDASSCRSALPAAELDIGRAADRGRTAGGPIVQRNP